MASFHQLALLMFGRGLQLLAGLITIKVATTILSPAQLGAVNQVMSLSLLIPSALLAPMALYIQRSLFQWKEEGTLRERLLVYLRTVLIVGAISGLLVLFLQNQFALVAGISGEWTSALIVIYIIGFSIHTMGTAGLNLLGRPIEYVVFTNLAVWGGLAFALYLSMNHSTPERWLSGIYAGYLLSSLAFFVLYQHSTRQTAAGSPGRTIPFSARNILMFVWPQALVFALWWIQSQSYRFVLDRVADITDVGLFAAGYMMCSVPIQTFESLFNEFYSPRLFRDLKNKDDAGIALAWNAYAQAYIPAVILFGLFIAGNAQFLVRLLLGEQFQAVTQILVLAAITETMRSVSSSLYTLGVAKMDMTVNFPPVVVGAVTSPILVYVLAPYDSLRGTALALLIAGAAALATVVPMTYRTMPIVWPLRRILAALALGVPVVFIGKAMSHLLVDLSDVKAFMAFALSGFLMVAFQYLMGRHWIRVSGPAAGAA